MRTLWIVLPLLLCWQTNCFSAETPRHSDNAAMQYWQAFAHLPALNDKQEKLLEEWKTVALEGDISKLLEASQASLLYLERASRCNTCAWDLHYEDGPGLLMPHLAKCRSLGMLAAIQMRMDFEKGKKAEGIARFGQILKLSRHAGSEPILISILVGYMIENVAFDAIAPYLPSLDAAQLTTLQKQMDGLPAFAQMKTTIATEKEYMCGWLLRKMDEAERTRPGSWRTAWVNILGPKPSAEDAHYQKLSQINTYAEAKKLADDLMPVYDQLQAAASLPFAEQARKLDSILAETRATNSFGVILLPAIQRAQLKEHRQLARQRLFQAALRVVASGKEQLQNMNDPYGDGPFVYQGTANGFELSSKLVVENKPVSYAVGR